MPASNPSLAEVLNRFGAGLFNALHVALPARVESYDAATQTIFAKPLIRGLFTEEDGSLSQDSLPVIPNVPVVFPGAGGFRLTFPIAVGDNVLLVFADRSIDAFQSGGGETAPADLRKHNLSDAIAIPGLHPSNGAWTGASLTDLTMGKDGGAQVTVKAAEIDVVAPLVNLGSAAAVEPLIKGTTMVSLQTTELAALIVAIGLISSALGAIGTAITSPATVTSNGPAATGACATAVTACTTLVTALTGVVSSLSSALSATVKTI